MYSKVFGHLWGSEYYLLAVFGSWTQGAVLQQKSQIDSGVGGVGKKNPKQKKSWERKEKLRRNEKQRKKEREDAPKIQIYLQ